MAETFHLHSHTWPSKHGRNQRNFKYVSIHDSNTQQNSRHERSHLELNLRTNSTKVYVYYAAERPGIKFKSSPAALCCWFDGRAQSFKCVMCCAAPIGTLHNWRKTCCSADLLWTQKLKPTKRLLRWLSIFNHKLMQIPKFRRCAFSVLHLAAVSFVFKKLGTTKNRSM